MTPSLRFLIGISMLLAFASLPPAGAAEKASLDDIAKSDEVWKASAGDFMLQYQSAGFGYMSGRTLARSVKPDMTFLGFRVWEARAYFDGETVKKVEFYLFNKGDAGAMSQEAFLALQSKVEKALKEWAGGKDGVARKDVSDRPNYFVKGRDWIQSPVGARLEWAFVTPHYEDSQQYPFRAEFLRVMLAPVSAGAASIRTEAPDWSVNTTATGLKKNVRSDSRGDMWVDNVPMVDQGAKGYCAAATAERILRYYKRSVDQHEIAQIADTTAKGGTSFEAMLDALRVIGKKYHLDMKDLRGDGEVRSFEQSQFGRVFADYNSEAAALGKQELSLEDYRRQVSANSYSIDVFSMVNDMDARTLRAARARNRQEMEGFKKDIVQYTKAGVPLTWAVLVGKYPENPPIQTPEVVMMRPDGSTKAVTVFGHIRMIIGFNAKTQEVLYTDSWGPGHELKRMPLKDAWTMTFGLCVLKPRDIR